MITRLDTEFFYNHGPRCHDPNSKISRFDQWWKNAQEMEVAFERASFLGYTFEWSRETQTNREWTQEGPEYPTWEVSLKSPLGYTVLNSMGGVDLGEKGEPCDDPYARICEATLVLEFLQRKMIITC